MTVLSANARRMIDNGVSMLADQEQRATWTSWMSDHAQGASSIEALPPSVVQIALAALETKAQRLRAERIVAPEDEVFYYDNDLSYVHAIERALKQSKPS